MRSLFNITSPKLAKDLIWVLERSKAKIILPSMLREDRKVRLIDFIDHLIETLRVHA